MTLVQILTICGLGLSELLALIPRIKSNSILQLIWNLLKKIFVHQKVE